ncbi:MAG: twin-arginine translocase subunit TatC [Candidatus Hydrogenedentes bacterium]|nr:twin-arginine translocase subunit TatC [Candidatus Hydrogenedentota bacterium]
MKDDEARMTFTEHLGELRTRLIRSCAAFLIGAVLCYIFSGILFDLIRRPLDHPGVFWQTSAAVTPETPGATSTEPGAPAAPEGQTPEAGGESTTPENAEHTQEQAVQWLQRTPMEWFLLSIKLSLYGGLLLTLPYILYQACAFIFPGLKENERRLVLIMLGGCSVLSLFGLLVAYFGVFPLVLPYILQWTPEGVTTMLSISDTVSLILMGLLAFAIVFQFPMVVLVLVYMDLLTPASLKQYRKQAIVGLAVLAAVATPPDPISMMMMMTPLVLLYEVSIWTSYLVVRRKRKASEAQA